MEGERWNLVQRPRTAWGRAIRRLIAAASLAACTTALGGCWPFNRPSPQQEYFDALKTGNSAQASQLWLQLTPEQRAKFERGEGIRPSVSHNDVPQTINEHYAEQNDDGSAPQHVDLTPSSTGAGLQDLTSYFKATGSAVAPQPAAPEQ
jgi:hypothetical protein